jgi:hypothetical protein
MDDETPEKRYPPSVSKMSKTPSWVMLGFVLGALFVLVLPNRQEEPAPPPPVKQERAPIPQPPREPPPISRIEAVFDEWGKHAVWHDDTTEVALWDPLEARYSDYYEVRRIDGVLYFRSIPKLTRRIINRGKEFESSPLQFTETEEQFREWDERDRARRPLERMWEPPPPKPPQVPPQMPVMTPTPAPEAQRITPPPWETRPPVTNSTGR